MSKWARVYAILSQVLFIIRVGGKWRRLKEGSSVGFTVPGYAYMMGARNVYWLPSKKMVEGCAVLLSPDDFYRIAFTGGRRRGGMCCGQLQFHPAKQ
jgi:hypothetical protein